MAAICEGTEDSVPFAMMGKSRQSKGTVGSLPSGQSRRRDQGVGNRLLRSFQFHCMAPRVRDSQLDEDQTAFWGALSLSLFLFLSRLCTSSSVSFLSPCLSQLPGSVAGLTGRGECRAQSHGFSRSLLGDGVM